MKRFNFLLRFGILSLILLLNYCVEQSAEVPAPAQVVATPGNSQVAVTWLSPFPSTNTTATFSVLYRQGTGMCRTTVGQDSCHVGCSNISVTACVVTGLTNGTAYTFTVNAQNGYEFSSSAQTGLVTPMANL